MYKLVLLLFLFFLKSFAFETAALKASILSCYGFFLEKNKTFEYVCWNSGFDPEIIHEKYKRLLKDGKVTFTELQKEWVKYRKLYQDYRKAKTSSERKEIMERIVEVNLKR